MGWVGLVCMEVDRGFGMMKKGGSKLGDWVTSKNEMIKKKKKSNFYYHSQNILGSRVRIVS